MRLELLNNNSSLAERQYVRGIKPMAVDRLDDRVGRLMKQTSCHQVKCI
jgi:hypothetical protein